MFHAYRKTLGLLYCTLYGKGYFETLQAYLEPFTNFVQSLHLQLSFNEFPIIYFKSLRQSVANSFTAWQKLCWITFDFYAS